VAAVTGQSGTQGNATELSNGTGYTFEVTATDSYGQVSGFSAPSGVAVPMGIQVIVFGPLPDQAFNLGTTTVSAIASSGLAVTYSSSTLPVCTVDPSSGTVTFVQTGVCTIVASQPGNDEYNPATSVPQSFNITVGSQAVTFSSAVPGSPVYTGSNNQTYVVAASASSGLPVVLLVDGSSTSGCVISGSAVSYGAGTGTCIIDADQAGDADYNPAQAQQSFVVGRAVPAVSVSDIPPPEAVYGGSFIPTVNTDSAGSISVSSSTPSVCAVNGTTVSFTGVGTCTLAAIVGAEAGYSAATGPAQSFTVEPAVLIIDADNLSMVYGQAPPAVGYTTVGLVGSDTIPSIGLVVLCGTSATSQSEVGSVQSTSCSGATSTTDYTVIYPPGTMTVTRATQTVSFSSAAPVGAIVGGSYVPAASASPSGLAVVFNIDPSTAANCSVTGGVVSLVAAGNCTVDADQLGGTDYSPAQAQQSFTVGADSPALTISAPGAATAGTVIAGNTVTSVLSGGKAAAGDLIFTVFGPQPAAPTSCADGGTVAGVASLSGNGVYSPGVGFTPDAIGDYWWYVSYSGDANDNPAASPCGTGMAETVASQATPEITLSVPSAGVAGTAVNGTAISGTLAGSSGPDASGTVTFVYFQQPTAPASCSGGTLIGTAPVSGDNAYSPTTGFTPGAAGNYWVYASYDGDTNNNPAASLCPPGSDQEIIVSQGIATDIITSSSSSVTVGTTVIYTANITGPGATPTGSVTFEDGGTPIGSCGTAGVVALFGGTASCAVTYTGTSGSPHSVTAPYSGDLNYYPATSGDISETVTVGTAADIVTAVPDPTGVGTMVTYTATVTGPGATPTGSVTFEDGGTPIGSCGTAGVVALSGGTANCTVTYTTTTGSPHSITSPYSGDLNYAPASSNTVSEAVGLGTQVALAINPASGIYGTPMTLTVSGGSGTGAVTLSVVDGTATGCAVADNVLTSSSAGSCMVTVTKAADADYNSASSLTAVTFALDSQIVSFSSAAPSPATVGGTGYIPAASSTSGLPVVIVVDPVSSPVCSSDDGTIIFLTSGICALDANQAGDVDYAAAGAQQAFPVVPAAPSDVEAFPADGQVAVDWLTDSNASSYTLYDNASGSYTAVWTGTDPNHEVTGLADGTQYGFYVTATGPGGVSAGSAPVLATPEPAPAAPAAPTATVPVDGVITLSWAASPAQGPDTIASYVVYEGVNNGGFTPVVQGVLGTSTLVSGLNHGDSYAFEVRAVDVYGQISGFSAAGGFVDEVPNAPAGLEVISVSSNQVMLSWERDTGATSYTVYNDGTAVVSGIVFNGTSAVVSDLPNNVQCSFTVTANNSGGESPQSSPAVTPTPEAPPTAPGGLNVTAGDASAVLSWSASSVTSPDSISSYTVYQCAAGCSGYTVAAVAGQSGTQATVTGLVDGTSYTFEVQVADSYGQTATSAPSIAVTPESPAQQYNDQVLSDSPNAFWELSDMPGSSVMADSSSGGTHNGAYNGNYTLGATGPITGAAALSLSGSGGGLASTVIPTGLYGYSVELWFDPSSVCAAAGSDCLLFSGGSQYDTININNPDNTGGYGLAFTFGNSPSSSISKLLSTSAFTAGTWYMLDLTVSPSGSWTVYIDGVPIGTGTSIAHPYLWGATGADIGGADIGVAGAAFSGSLANVSTYIGTALSAAQVAADWAASQATYPALTVSSIYTTYPTSGQVIPYWLAVPGATSYSLYQEPTQGTNPACTVTTNYCTVAGLSNDTTYSFYVVASNPGYTSGPSAITTATPEAAPGPPTGLTVAPSDSKVIVSWDAPTGTYPPQQPLTYDIYYDTGDNGYSIAAQDVSGSPYPVTGLTDGTAYSFEVTAIDQYGQPSVPSSPSADVIPEAPPTTPGTPTAIAGNASAVLDWSPSSVTSPDSISSYTVYQCAAGCSEYTVAAVTGQSGTQATVTGLVDGTSYTFEVQVADSYGQTATSAPSNAATPAAVEPSSVSLGTVTAVTYGGEEAESFTATVTGQSGDGYPEGSVALSNGSTPLCTGTLGGTTSDTASFSCSLTATQLAAGTYTQIIATFTPSTPSSSSAAYIYGGSVSGTQSLTVNNDPTLTTVSMSPTSVVYGSGTSVTFTVGVTAFYGVPVPSGGNVSVFVNGVNECTATLTSPNNCSWNVTGLNAGSFPVTATYNGDINIAGSTGNGTSLIVTAEPVTVTVSGSQTYGGSPTFTYTTVPSGVTVSSLNCATVGTSTAISSSLDAGSYTILGSSCSGTASSNYSLTFAGANSGFAVTAEPVAVTVSGSQTYGGSPTFTYTTVPSGVTVSSLNCATVNTSITISSSLAAGSYTVLGNSCSGTASSNYSLTFAGANSGFAVTAEPVAVTVSGSQTYGGSPTFTYTTVPSGVTVSSLSCTTVGASTAISSSLDAGSYTILGSSCSGTASSNYSLTFTGATNGFVISQATPISVTISDLPGSVSGGNFTATVSVIPSGDTGTVSVSSSTTSVCTVAGFVVSYVGAGTCTLKAAVASTTDYVAATGNPQSFTVMAADLMIAAGNGAGGPLDIGSSAATTVLSTDDVTTDSAGNIYIADQSDDVVLMVPASNGTYFGQSMTADNVYVVAGVPGTAGTSANGIAAISSELNEPEGVAVDSLGNLYIADYNAQYVMMVVNKAGPYLGITSTSAGDMYRVAGTGVAGTSTNGIAAISSELNYPGGVAVDSSGNLYIADTNANYVMMVPNVAGTYLGHSTSMTVGDMYEVAGTGTGGAPLANGTAATSSALQYPYGVAVDSSGNLYIADTMAYYAVMVVNATGTYFGQSMTIVGGMYKVAGTGSSGTPSVNGTAATSSALSVSTGVAVDSSGNLYIADSQANYAVMIVNKAGSYLGTSATTVGGIYRVAGTGTAGVPSVNGTVATSSELNIPHEVAVDSSGNLYIADTQANDVVMVPNTAGTYIGTSMSVGDMYDIAGVGPAGAPPANGTAATSASLNNPDGVAVDSLGNLYIANSSASTVAMVPAVTGTYFGQTMTAGDVYEVAGTGTAGAPLANGTAATSSDLSYPDGVAVDSLGNLYIADTSVSEVVMVVNKAGTYLGTSMTTVGGMYRVAGTGSTGTPTNNIAATSSNLNGPRGVAVDSLGNLYIADTNASYVVMVPNKAGSYLGTSAATVGYMYNVAGTGNAGSPSTNIAATNSSLNYPYGLAVDSSGNLYIADTSASDVVMVPAVSGTYFGQTMTLGRMYEVAGTNTAGSPSASGTAATSSDLSYPEGLAVDSSGNLYIADSGVNYVVMVPAAGGTYFGQTMTSGRMYEVVGTGTAGAPTTGGAGTNSDLDEPTGTAVDSSGNLYIADNDNQKVEKLT
jgi:sugar lactone lactonase YvrE